jgi:hypothetical protein
LNTLRDADGSSRHGYYTKFYNFITANEARIHALNVATAQDPVTHVAQLDQFNLIHNSTASASFTPRGETGTPGTFNINEGAIQALNNPANNAVMQLIYYHELAHALNQFDFNQRMEGILDSLTDDMNNDFETLSFLQSQRREARDTHMSPAEQDLPCQFTE